MRRRLDVVKTRGRLEKTKEAASVSRGEKMEPKLGRQKWGCRGQGSPEIILEIFRRKSDIGLRVTEPMC